MKLNALTYITLALAAFSGFSLCSAADFHVKTGIYVAPSKEPVQEHLTSFQNKVIYDTIISRPGDATVIDFNTGLVHLINGTDKTQLVLKHQDVLEVSAHLSAKLNTMIQANPQAVPARKKFYLLPKFETSTPNQGEMLFSGNPITYKVTTTPIQDNLIAQDYYRFCNWSAYLNYITIKGGDSPNARIYINDQLKNKQVLPSIIQRTIRDPNPANNSIVESRHTFRWKSVPEDTQRIAEIRQAMSKFNTMNLDEFIKKYR